MTATAVNPVAASAAPSSARPVSLGAAALGAAGVLFLLYPVTRPWHDETTLEGARASMGSGWWVASHLFAMLAFVLVPLGLLALRSVLATTRAEPLAAAAAVAAWIGAGLTLPYYGAEDFALHAAAGRAGELDLLALSEDIRFGAAAMTTFGLGLILLAVAGILAGVAVWRSGVLPRWSGVPFALGLALFLPQFFTPAASRIGHGVLLAAGCVWLAIALRSAAARMRRHLG